MKEITKHRLKQVNRLLKIGVLTFCWLMACVGLTAYSVYWLRQNANYEQEISKRDLKPKYLNNDNDRYVSYRVREISYYNTDDFSAELERFIIDPTYNLIPNKSATYLEFYASNNFNCYFEADGYVSNPQILVREIGYIAGADVEGYYFSRLQYQPNTASIMQFNYNDAISQNAWTYQFINGITSSNSMYFNGSLTCAVYTQDWVEYDVQLDTEAIFNLLFEVLYDSDNSQRFEFTEDYNFGRLTSEVVTSERLIVPYNNQYNGDPSDEFIYFYSLFNFVSNGQLYRGLCYVFSKPIYIYRNSLQQVNFAGSMSQLQIKQVLYMRTLPSSINTLYNWLAVASNYDVVANKHILRYEDYNDGQRDLRVAVYDYKQYDWVNQSYRLLSINSNDYNAQYDYECYPNDNTMWSNRLYIGLTLYQVLNNGYMDYNYYTNTYDDSNNNLGMAFTLIGSAFSGLTSLMFIQVLPGITLGMLFLIPLIVTLIIVVIRLVKK